MDRRSFLSGGAGLVVGAVAGYAVGTSGGKKMAEAPKLAAGPGEPIVLKFQSTWPAKDIFHEYAQDYANRVNAMAGGRLKLDLLTAGSVVPAFQMQDAVNTGALDGGHGVTAYWYGKNKAFSLFGTGPSWGWNANEMIGWFYYGGGRALYDELVTDILKLDLVGFITGPMPTQPLGWFKKEVKGPGDLKGLKYRTVGLSADLFKELGSAVTILPGGEIVPSMDRGVLDAAEFNNPSSDRGLGFPDVSKVYMLQSYHQPNECFEIIFNKAKYDSLPPDLQAVLRYASEAASADMSWKAQDRYSKDLAEMEATQGVKTYVTPISVLRAQLAAWSKLVDELSKDAFFAKIIDSQKAWVKRVSGFSQRYDVNGQLAYQHFFGAKS